MNKKNYFDCHCHILPGLDDGPRDIEESVEMACALSSLGFTRAACTPHFLKDVYENDVGKVNNAVAALQNKLTKHKINFTLHPSVEYRLDEYLFTLLDNPMPVEENIVLIELPRHIQTDALLNSVYSIIVNKKLRPMIAHPERHDLFDELMNHTQRVLFGPLMAVFHGIMGTKGDRSRGDDIENDTVMVKLRSMGCRFQGNIGSFAGIYGEQVRKRAINMLKNNLFDRLGTDAHRQKGLSNWLKDGLDVIHRETDKTYGLNLMC